MKKFSVMLMLIGLSLSAYLWSEKGNKQELYTKACDGGDMKGCKNYKILNEEGIF